MENLLKEGLIKSARTICERIFITARRDFAEIIVFISRNRNKAVAKNPQSAADAFNQRFLNQAVTLSGCMGFPLSWEKTKP